MADRRSKIRFEIVGRLRGTIVSEEVVTLENLSRGGALVRTPWPLTVDSVYSLRVESDSALATMEGRVRHVRPRDSEDYLVGLEFIGLDSHLAVYLDRIIEQGAA